MIGRPRAASCLPPPSDLRGYPSRELAKGEVVCRSHHKDHGPGYFSSAPADPGDGGRFDLPTPDGTCYAAKDALVALRERFGPELVDHGEAPASAVAEVRVSRMRLQERVALADTAAERAGNFHTLELVTSPDYSLTQKWAKGSTHAASTVPSTRRGSPPVTRRLPSPCSLTPAPWTGPRKGRRTWRR